VEDFEIILGNWRATRALAAKPMIVLATKMDVARPHACGRTPPTLERGLAFSKSRAPPARASEELKSPWVNAFSPLVAAE
jgi:hypothetical protein